MRNFDKALWAVVAVLGAMVLMVFVSHAKAPEKLPPPHRKADL